MSPPRLADLLRLGEGADRGRRKLGKLKSLSLQLRALCVRRPALEILGTDGLQPMGDRRVVSQGGRPPRHHARTVGRDQLAPGFTTGVKSSLQQLQFTPLLPAA